MENMKELEQEFVSLIEEHKRIIYKVCCVYATDKEHLSDLYQETVMNLWCAYPKFRGESAVSTWIYRISLNTCISFLRKSGRRVVSIPLPGNLEAIAEEDEKIIRLRELYRMINLLGKLERALILLWLEERSYQEIADIIGISKQNVGVRLNRIKEKLKKMSEQ